MVVHDEVLAERPTLLEPVLHAAGLAIEIARLRVELRRQLAEVEASRERIVTASYEERRRIERDLHDGTQQRLVAVGLALRHLQHELPPSANGLGDGIDEAVGQVGKAVTDLRELARGVRPTRLDEGLASALRELARRSPVPVKIEVTSERFAAEIEAGRVEIAEASVEALPFAERSFHCAFTVHTIYFWPQPDEGLAEVARVLRPGGRLVLVTSLKPPPKAIAKHGFGHLERSEQQIMLSRAGFTDIEFVTRGAALFATARRAP